MLTIIIFIEQQTISLFSFRSFSFERFLHSNRWLRQVYETNRERSETQIFFLHRMNARRKYEIEMADRKFISSPLKHY